MTAGVHPMGDLAPRVQVDAGVAGGFQPRVDRGGDHVARLKATGDACVYLDARHIFDFADRFPTVTAACRAAGIDPVRQPIPVVPGAHYSSGAASRTARSASTTGSVSATPR
ncbi:hypothetical protein JHV675_54800 [Mycobacterium avium subsp. hominissuis]